MNLPAFNRMLLTRLAVVALAVLPFCHGNAEEQNPNHIWLRLEGIAVSVEDLVGLLSTHGGDQAALHASARKLVESGRASIAFASALSTAGSVEAKSAGVVQWPFATGWEPGSVPVKIAGPVKPGTDLRQPPLATEFATRALGLSWRCRPVFTRDEYRFGVSVETATWLKNDSWGMDICRIEQPRFFSSNITVNCDCRDGQWTVLGTTTPPPVPNAEERARQRVLWFFQPSGAAMRAPLPDAIPTPAALHVVEAISVPQALGRELLARDVPARDATPLYQAIQQLIEAKKAVVRECVAAHTVSGLRMKVGSGEEISYPVNFDPPQIPQDFTGPVDPSVKLRVPVFATVFTTRNTGISLELSSDAKEELGTVLNVQLDVVEFLGRSAHGHGDSAIETPDFRSRKINSAAGLQPSGVELLGVWAPVKRSGKADLPNESTFIFVRNLPLSVP